MFLPNRNALHGKPLDAADAETLGIAGADTVERFLAHRDNHVVTPLHALPALAGELGLCALHVKDEGFRLGLGSFKALGGAYAVFRLVLEEAGKWLGRPADVVPLGQRSYLSCYGINAARAGRWCRRHSSGGSRSRGRRSPFKFRSNCSHRASTNVELGNPQFTPRRERSRRRWRRRRTSRRGLAAWW